MFGIKKSGWNIKDFCKELEGTICKKAYGIALADEVFCMLCGYFQDRADCIACYEYGGREVFFRATLPEDEAAFYRKDFQKRADNARTKENKAMRIWTENGALCGMWVLEIHSGMDEGMETFYQEMVSVAQAVFSACLFAEEWKKEQGKDCVTGLFGNAAFEKTLQQFMEQGVDGYLIAAKCPVWNRRPYAEGGMNQSIQALAAACKKSGIPYVYRIGEDTAALLCLEGQERAYAAAQELADIGEIDLYVARFAALENGKVYSMIQQNLDRTEENVPAFGLQYLNPKLPIYRDYPEGGGNGKEEP